MINGLSLDKKIISMSSVILAKLHNLDPIWYHFALLLLKSNPHCKEIVSGPIFLLLSSSIVKGCLLENCLQY